MGVESAMTQMLTEANVIAEYTDQSTKVHRIRRWLENLMCQEPCRWGQDVPTIPNDLNALGDLWNRQIVAMAPNDDSAA